MIGKAFDGKYDDIASVKYSVIYAFGDVYRIGPERRIWDCGTTYQCIGTFDNYLEAYGCGYLWLNQLLDEHGDDRFRKSHYISRLVELESDAGFGMSILPAEEEEPKDYSSSYGLPKGSIMFLGTFETVYILFDQTWKSEVE